MANIAGANFLQYNQMTEKAGDTVTAPGIGTAETAFASKLTLKGGSVTSGAMIRIDFFGKYSSSAVLAVPMVTPRVKIGTTTIIQTPAVNNAAGATDLGFSGFVLVTIVNGTATNNVKSSGQLTFASSSTASVVINVPAVINSVDFSTDKDLALSVQYSNNNAGNSLTLQQMVITRSGAVNASN